VASLYRSLGYAAPPAGATAAELGAARASVASARATLTAANEAAASRADIATAAAALELARESLATLRAASLTPLPAAEVVFLGNENSVVSAIAGVLGGAPQLGAVTLSSETADTLWATVPRSVAARLTVESTVEVDVNDSDGGAPSDVAGFVSWIASETGAAGTEGRFGPDFVVPDGMVGIEVTLTGDLPRDIGATLRAAIDVDTGASPGLVVPIAAVHTAADGHSTVTVASKPIAGAVELTVVPVTEIDTLEGRALVDSADLEAGDEVVIP
jgi:hypothetical protein